MKDTRSQRSRQRIGMDDSASSIYNAKLAAFVDMHNAEVAPPVEVQHLIYACNADQDERPVEMDDMDDDDIDVQLDVCDYMQQMGDRLDAA